MKMNKNGEWVIAEDGDIVQDNGQAYVVRRCVHGVQYLANYGDGNLVQHDEDYSNAPTINMSDWDEIDLTCCS